MSNKRFLAIILALVMVIVNINFALAANYEYDELGRLVSVEYGNSEDKAQTATYGYDAGGNITAVKGFNTGTTEIESATEATTTEVTTTEISTESPTETTTEAPVIANELVWNYTTGENTDNFYTINANEWGSSVTLTYDTLTLNKAVKMESSTNISFNAPQAGTLKVVTYSTKTAPAIKLNGTSYPVSANGVVVFELPEAGTYTITKDTTNTYLYYMSFVYEASAPVENPYIWNYTDNTNTDDFYTVTANEWNTAVPVTYGDITLTKAIKMESNTSITFTAPKSGVLALVTYSTKSAPSVKINGQTYSVSANGSVDIKLTEGGTYTITKDTTNTYLYYMSYVSD